MPKLQTIQVRKPVGFPQYYFLIVKVGRIWCIDHGSWSRTVVEQALREEKRLNPGNKAKICTSPSDDDKVTQRILREYNRFA